MFFILPLLNEFVCGFVSISFQFNVTQNATWCRHVLWPILSKPSPTLQSRGLGLLQSDSSAFEASLRSFWILRCWAFQSHAGEWIVMVKDFKKALNILTESSLMIAPVLQPCCNVTSGKRHKQQNKLKFVSTKLTCQVAVRMITEIKDLMPSPPSQILQDFHCSFIVDYALLQLRDTIPRVWVGFFVINSVSIEKLWV